MCGIVGFTNNISNSDEVLSKMMDRIKHRGPDAYGKYIDDDIALGHRRLSIIDVSSSGDQPIFNEDNTLVTEYPAPEIYKTLSDEEKKNIIIFKNEIEKITLEKGFGRVSVNISYDGSYREKEFIIKYSNGFTKEYYEKEIEKIDEHMKTFSKKNNLYDFFLDSYILLRD